MSKIELDYLYLSLEDLPGSVERGLESSKGQEHINPNLYDRVKVLKDLCISLTSLIDTKLQENELDKSEVIKKIDRMFAIKTSSEENVRISILFELQIWVMVMEKALCDHTAGQINLVEISLILNKIIPCLLVLNGQQVPDILRQLGYRNA